MFKATVARIAANKVRTMLNEICRQRRFFVEVGGERSTV